MFRIIKTRRITIKKSISVLAVTVNKVPQVCKKSRQEVFEERKVTLTKKHQSSGPIFINKPFFNLKVVFYILLLLPFHVAVLGGACIEFLLP